MIKKVMWLYCFLVTIDFFVCTLAAGLRRLISNFFLFDTSWTCYVADSSNMASYPINICYSTFEKTLNSYQ